MRARLGQFSTCQGFRARVEWTEISFLASIRTEFQIGLKFNY